MAIPVQAPSVFIPAPVASNSEATVGAHSNLIVCTCAANNLNISRRPEHWTLSKATRHCDHDWRTVPWGDPT